jgi:hypothetical protein
MILLPQKAVGSKKGGGGEGESASAMLLCTRCLQDYTHETSAIGNIAALHTPIARYIFKYI